MAEFVHQRLEEMLPELEEMSSSGLFTQKETKIILKKREALEYRLRQRTKTKMAYLSYIEYEQKLLDLTKIRKKKYAINFNSKELENAIIDRINNLHRLLTTRFPEDVSLWEKHIKFCMDTLQHSYISRLYAKILRLHSHREDMWVKAAQFERSPNGNGNPEAAREMLLKAQRVLPNSETIYLEMYQMELDLATVIIKRKKVLKISEPEDADDKTSKDAAEKKYAEFKLAEIVSKKSLEIFPNNPKFHLKMLNVCSKFELASHQMKELISQLRKLYSDKPEVWNALAMCHLNNFKNRTEENKKAAVDKCMETFQEGLEKAPSESMWSYCLNGHLHLLRLRHKASDAPEILSSTLRLFQNAISRSMLSEELYQMLISMLTKMELYEDAYKVAERGVASYPTSSSLWHAHLSNMAVKGVAVEELLKTFRVASRKLTPETSWPLWQFMLHYCTAKDTAALESLMEEACRSITPEVCMPAKEWSLEWTFRKGGIKKARQVYKSLKCMRPIRLEFYRRYIHIENSQPDPSIDHMRSAFEEALAEFGQTEQGVWLNYMEMEKMVAQDGPKAGLVQQRALHNLRPDLKEEFIRTNTMLSMTASA